MRAAAANASAMMKVLGHPGRLMVLCFLAEGEKSVGDLAELVEMPQSSLSQHLARMRAEGLVETRREQQNVYYRLAAGEVDGLIHALHEIFCP
jgi:DNA-binding transcriptional ArsR family regulator